MKERERNLGVDALRILAMLMIVVYHMLGHGWILPLIHETSWKFELLTALNAVCMAGVDCFVLISGYVGVRSRVRYASLALQWARVLFYSVAITGIAAALVPGGIGKGQWLAAFTPTVSGQYWYFSAYAGCFMLSPLICTAIRSMKPGRAGTVAASLLAVFSVLSNVTGGDPFYTNGGSNTLWLVVLYAVGAYFGWFRPHERIPMAALWAGAAVSAALLGGYIPVGRRLISPAFRGFVKSDFPLTVLLAVSLLLLFSRLKITRGRRLLSALSAASFSVYLIHDHPLTRQYVIARYVSPLSGLGTGSIVPGIVAAAAGIYLCCAVIDLARAKLFDALHIRKRLAALEERLLGNAEL